MSTYKSSADEIAQMMSEVLKLSNGGSLWDAFKKVMRGETGVKDTPIGAQPGKKYRYDEFEKLVNSATRCDQLPQATQLHTMDSGMLDSAIYKLDEKKKQLGCK